MISIAPLVSSPMSQSIAKPDAKLAPSQGAAPDGFHRTLTDGLAAADLRLRSVCIEALGKMLQTGHFSRGGGSEHIGSGPRLEDWRPGTYGEVRAFYREATKRLTAVASSDDPLAGRAKALLSSHIRGLIRNLPVGEVEAMITSVIAHSGFWPDALEGISDWLYFDRDGAPPKLAAEVRRLYDSLLPADPVELAMLYTAGWPADLHDPDTVYDRSPDAKRDFEYSGRQATAVAQIIAKDKVMVARVVSQMACSDAKGAFLFAKELVRSVADPTGLFEAAVSTADASDKPANRPFFGGLIAGADERDRKLARKFMRRAILSPKLKPDAVSLIGSGLLQPEDIGRVIALLKNKDIAPWQCASLSYGRGLNHLQFDDFLPLLVELENHGSEGGWAVLDMLGMYLHGGANQATRELIALAKRTLLIPGLVASVRTNMDGYHLQQMVERLAAWGAISKSYAKRLAGQLLGICKKSSDRVFYELDDPVRESLGILMRINPPEVWAEIARKVMSKQWDVRFYAEHVLEAKYKDNDHLGRGIAVSVPTDLIVSWVRDDPKRRASVAVSWLPIAVEGQDGTLKWSAEIEGFVAEFAAEPNVLTALGRRFYPTSWWGGLAPHLEPIVPLLERWHSHRDQRVREWVARSIEGLKQSILEERKRTEEDAVRQP